MKLVRLMTAVLISCAGLIAKRLGISPRRFADLTVKILPVKVVRYLDGVADELLDIAKNLDSRNELRVTAVEEEGASTREFEQTLYGHNAPSAGVKPGALVESSVVKNAKGEVTETHQVYATAGDAPTAGASR